MSKQILVMGMHRSGTSMVSRILNLMGCYYSSKDQVILPAEDNPKGFWERKDVMDLNNKILHDHQATWDNPYKLKDIKINNSLYSKDIKNIIYKLEPHRPWFIKDPRFCLTYNCWANELEHNLNIVVLRNPLAVSISLFNRDKISYLSGLALWDFYTDRLIKNLDKKKTILCFYDDFLQDPYKASKNLFNSLKKEKLKKINEPIKEEVMNFVDKQLNRSKLNSNIHLFDQDVIDFYTDKYNRIKTFNSNFSTISQSFINTEQQAKTITTLNQSLTTKDEKIHNLSSSLSQRTEETEQQARTITTLNQTLSERDANLQYFISAKSEILNSTSWRVTYPIRLVKDFIKYSKKMANQKFTLIKHIHYRLLNYDLVWQMCKKIGNAAIKVGFSASWIYSIRKNIRRQNYLLDHNIIATDIGREDINNYLPSKSQKLPLPRAVLVTVIIPVYRGLEETKRCLNSVLRCSGKVPVKILVIDDCTPEPEISSWLETIALSGKIRLLKNEVNLGFVASVNLGIIEAGNQDVVLLNSDTVVNSDWLDRLVWHAYLNPRIGSVTPFSNNATICSWPSIEGGDLPNGISLDAIDEACSIANRGRQVELPTAVGFCMYIRRDCLTEVGLFDVAAFGKGYGEENDFCMRAAAIGWKHVLACDTFVYHVGETSFGKNSNHRTTGWEVLIKRHPDYPELVQQHIQADKAASARLAVVAALYKAASKPVILLITHALGGGTDRHVKDLIDESDQCANFILLDPTETGIQLSVPQIKGLSTIIFQPTEVLILVELLKSFGVSRCHIHHWIGNEMDICKLIDSLGVSFDLTIHDYYSICPRINLVRPTENNYCGEPGPGECNTCITDLSTQGITDITEWRNRKLWMFNEAERVICPSEDSKRRIMLYYPHARLMVAPHQFVEEDLWSVKVPQLKKGDRMRIVVLGAIVKGKGLDKLIAAAEINQKLYKFIVIGYTHPPIPYRLRHIITVRGRYEENELNSLISKENAHVVWFPNIWPETYSYTLSSALKAKLPIIAPTLGAFPERLENRPLTWLFDQSSDTSKLNKLFEQIHDVLSKQTATDLAGKRKITTNNFYKSDYLLPH